MADEYAQQTRTICTSNDPSCVNSQKQFDIINMQQAQLNANAKYGVAPSPSPKPAKTVVLVSHFTSLQSASMGLFVAAALLIVYGLVATKTKGK